LFILFAVLGGVVFTIIAPVTPPPTNFAFKGTLDVMTSNVVAVENVINSSDLAVTPTVENGKTKYVITGSRETVAAIVTKLGGEWDSFDSTKLTVESKTGEQTRYDNLRVPDITALINPMIMPGLTKDEGDGKAVAGTPKPQKIVLLTIVVSDGK
jgi:hypothetical protein